MANEITMYRGDDKTITLTFTDSDGNAIDITDYTVYFTVKNSVSDSDANAKISKDVTSHTNPTSGITQIALTPSDTSSLNPGAYEYDIQTKDGSGNINTVLTSTFVLKYDVTVRTD